MPNRAYEARKELLARIRATIERLEGLLERCEQNCEKAPSCVYGCEELRAVLTEWRKIEREL